MGADTSTADIIGTIAAVIGAGRSVGLMIVQTGPGPIASIGISAVIVRRVATGRASGQGRMRTNTRSAHITSAIAAVIGANGTVGFMIPQAGPGPVTGIRVGTVIVRGVTTGRTGREIRMRAHSGGTHIIGAVVTVIGAGGAIRLVIVQTGARPVTGIRIGTVIVRGVAASRTGREIRMRAHSG